MGKGRGAEDICGKNLRISRKGNLEKGENSCTEGETCKES
jgi:hypothetical protein